jgi:hypothetical protein
VEFANLRVSDEDVMSTTCLRVGRLTTRLSTVSNQSPTTIITIPRLLRDCRLFHSYPRLYSQSHLRIRNMSSPYALEEQVAISAVRRACSLTSSVFNKLVKNETLVKGDKSPVTGKSHLPSSLFPSCYFFPNEHFVFFLTKS